MNKKRVRSNLRALLHKYDLEQKELAEMTGLSVRTISELANDKTVRYPKHAIEAIINALDITDFNDILTIVDEE